MSSNLLKSNNLSKGNWAHGKATILDVAKLAQVSKKTVSRVLNKEPNVKKETVAKVEQAMAALDYRPSLSARSLASNRSYLIALLYDNPVAHYIIDVQSGVLDFCKSQGYSLIIQPCRHSNNESTQVIEELVRQSNIDGFVLTPPFSDMATVIACLENLSKPYVRIAPVQHETGSDCVYCDDYKSAYEMTCYLISLNHRQIGFIVGHPDHAACQLRFQGYKQALRDNKIKFQANLIAQGDNSFESGLRCAERLLLLKHPPTAIFASNDEMAAGVMAIAHQHGRKIPSDLSIAGFDDNPIAAQIWPQLTTVRQPVTDMARDAAKILIQNLGKRGQSVTGQADAKRAEHLLPCQLIYRQSTGPCPDGDMRQ